MSTEAQVLPFPRDERESMTRIGVVGLAQLWRLARRTGGPDAARDVVAENARVVALALREAFGDRAPELAETYVRALLTEIDR